MRVFHRWEEVPADTKGGALAIGNFDGLHLGHVSLLKAAKQKAGRLPLSLLTFFPHPLEVLYPEKRLARITTANEKLALLEDLGIDQVLVAPFSKAVSQKTAAEFFDECVWKTFAPKSLHVGSDFHFGNGREGNLAWLVEKAKQVGFELCPSPLVEVNGKRISSTEIRKLLAEGDAAGAAGLLGRPYQISGQVEHGDHRGRQLGFPTANVSYPDDKVLPKNGVYVTEVCWQKQTFPSITNVGIRPTVTAGQVAKARIEAHLFNFSTPLYDEILTVRFLSRVRDEKKFASLDELKGQVQRDIADAKAWFVQNAKLRKG